ncbi:hypothetical protein JTB14_002760 [Gonioctena quinquepunctata]|nr:hypothetical protein JTB14_002760 [Gonioctena quinquepunctata]
MNTGANYLSCSIVSAQKTKIELDFYRVYLQAQNWLSCKMDPEEWDWEMSPTLNSILMKTIFKIIFCNCKSGCMKEICTCRKNALLCSNICQSCCVDTCKNVPRVIDEHEIEDDDDDDVAENNNER